jgi:hypothetical protein
MDLCYSKAHIDTFVILSGDSDFSPLVSKLRENGKHVIGLGLRGSTSNLLVSNCDEFIFYEAIVQPQGGADAPLDQAQMRNKGEVLKLITDTVAALLREGRDPIQASLVKDTIQRKQPSFSEADYGYRSFTDLLEEAQSQGLIAMREDPKSGTYQVNLAKRPAKPAARSRSRRRKAPKPVEAAPTPAADPANPNQG